jgi:hypothetical protein
MSDEIAAIFSKYLPTVDASDAFAKGMRSYHNVYKVQRDGDMNFSGTPEYYNWQLEIMVLKPDDYWVHSPQFRKVMGLAIGEMFKTKITIFTPPATVGIPQSSMMFIDVHFNRWLFTISETDAGEVRLFMRFPVTNTKVAYAGVVEESQMCNAAYNASGLHVLAMDASVWHA